MRTFETYSLEEFMYDKEDMLMEKWDEYKYEELEGEFFHYDNVDFFDEEMYAEMCAKEYEKYMERRSE